MHYCHLSIHPNPLLYTFVLESLLSPVQERCSAVGGKFYLPCSLDILEPVLHQGRVLIVLEQTMSSEKSKHKHHFWNKWLDKHAPKDGPKNAPKDDPIEDKPDSSKDNSLEDPSKNVPKTDKPGPSKGSDAEGEKGEIQPCSSLSL